MASHTISLQAATKSSTVAWQHDLEQLFHLARDRFPDVVWDLADEEVWGHKAIVYARAPPSFQNRYFSFRPFSATSAFSLPLDHSRSPSPFRTASPGPPSATPLRLTTSINPTLFANELEYLYTGKGFGEAFEFLFDSPEAREEGADAEDLRIDKLRKDLVFMWRSRLYSDVRIALTGNFAGNHSDTTAIFSSHRFILISRSPYFHNALLAWPSPPNLPNEPLTLSLPSPPFTPASLHFTLGFIYTGTLVFSHRTYDLDTAFHIMRSATYLSIDSLYDEIQARIVQEMMHGLFHAFLEFAEYESLTAGKWGSSGCRCRQCARRAPRILEFAIADDVKNPILDRGSRRALVGLFGEGWCTSEFASLNPKLREGILKGLGKRTTPQNVLQLLYSAEHAMTKLTPVIDSWADIVREMILAARKNIDECLASQAEECFAQPDWLEIMESDGVGFQDADRVKLIMAAAVRGINDKNAATLYQTLVSSILLHPHATESDATMLSSTSVIRVSVEQARIDVLHFIRKRWMSIRQEGGFDSLQPWALKEISDDIEVSTTDLAMPAPSAQKSMVMRSSLRPSSQLDVNSDVGSVHSLRVSLLNRNVTPSRRGATPTHRDSGLASSASSFRSTSTVSRATVGRSSNKHAGQRPDSKLTPPSIIEPAMHEASASPEPGPSVSESVSETTSSTADEPTPPSSPRIKTLIRRPESRTPSSASRRSLASTSSSRLTPDLKPRASVSSIRSRNGRLASTTPSTSSLRPASSLSTTTSVTSDDGSTTFKTAPASVASRSRRTSTASTVSNVSIRSSATANASLSPSTRARRTSTASTASTTTGLGSAPPPRSRRTSTASVASTSGGASPRTPSKRPPVPPVPSPDASSIRSNSRRPASLRSVASTVSTAASASKKATATVSARKPTAAKAGTRPPALQTATAKGKQPETSPVPSVGPSLRRKGSTDTITPTATIPPSLPAPSPVLTEPVAQAPLQAAPVVPKAPTSPRGATLDIGIPCIISSKRKRFKALARYIGEVEGETGPWVGVEVPVAGDLSWSSYTDKDGDVKENMRSDLDNRQWYDPEGRLWHDGSWGGVRYFEIGNIGGSDYWDSAEDRERAARRRRLEGLTGSTMVGTVKDAKGLLKREGDQLSVERAKRMRSVSPAASDMSSTESRGLFVRPQQVLYVVDAVGGDW
ncbi:hypothetical protein HGRIS_011216 [Hohenbuehelia grisea]|uniref:BTB domain-containing protein n=1 Tax=Hohenbuehelia grisea TaxID=104357 RepID=A0ABR3JUJ3_9AGAR